MPRMVDPFLQELDQEVAVTRRLLERVPKAQLDWKPHPKSMTLGQLALHVARVPGIIAGALAADELDVDTVDFTPEAPKSADELLPALDESLGTARDLLNGWDDATAGRSWRLVRGGEPLMEAPRIGVARGLMLNHWYHHRGQLTVYLRMLDVALPATYGRSADENPLAG